MRVRTAQSMLATLALLGVAACDRALIKVTNTTQEPVVMRYWHVNYDRWSPTVPFAAGEQIPLARGHHFAEVRCLEIREGKQEYHYNEAALTKLHAVCDGAHACDLRYGGNGAVQATRSALNRLPSFGAETAQPPTRPCW